MGSTRLPGKVLEDLAGQPMLARVVSRTRQAKTLDSVTIATTTLPADDAIVKLCKKMGWPCFRGSQDDVLDRYYRAALAFKADTVIRITSDCPLTDPGVIDLTVNAFLGQYPAVDYVSNSQTRTFPRGLDVEVFSFSALEKAWREDYNPAWREHVTIYLYRHPEKFKLLNVANDIDYSAMRWTVDTPEDLALVRQIYNHFQNNSFREARDGNFPRTYFQV
ncbi:MAG: glycosyltransferase family protein [Chloroflexi bacterium]|nr:glycosyltransferase family protein [Chloroflexota bacterium]